MPKRKKSKKHASSILNQNWWGKSSKPKKAKKNRGHKSIVNDTSPIFKGKY